MTSTFFSFQTVYNPKVFQPVTRRAGDKRKGSPVTGNIGKHIWRKFRIPAKFDLLAVSLRVPK